MSYPNIIQKHTNDINTIKSTYLPLSGGTVKSLHCNSPLVIKAANTEYEGGELVLEYPSESYPYKSTIDNYKGQTRIFSNYNGTTYGHFVIDHMNNTILFNAKHIVRSINNVPATSDGNVTIPTFKLFSETGCNTLAELPEGFYYIRGDAELNPSDKPISNWGMLICCYNGGTPFQIYEDDCSVKRWKRWCSGGVWSEWTLA